MTVKYLNCKGRTRQSQVTLKHSPITLDCQASNSSIKAVTGNLSFYRSKAIWCSRFKFLHIVLLPDSCLFTSSMQLVIKLKCFLSAIPKGLIISYRHVNLHQKLTHTVGFKTTLSDLKVHRQRQSDVDYLREIPQ